MTTVHEISRTNPIDLIRARDWADHLIWSKLLSKYDPLLRGICRRFRLSVDDANDVVQIVWDEVSRNLQSFEYDPKKRFRGYLARLCMFRARDQIRGRRWFYQLFNGLARVEPSVEEPDTVDPSELRPVFDLIADVQRVVQSEVSEVTWKAYWMIAIEQQTVSEVARALGKKRSTVFAAKQRVAVRLRDEGERRRGELA